MGVENLLTVKDVASRLKCSTRFVHKLVRDKRIKAKRMSERKIRITEESYLEFLSTLNS